MNFQASTNITSSKLLLVGDFIFHVDDNSDYYAYQFQALIQNVGLVQHIHQATHKDGHTLDLIITKEDSTLVSQIHITPLWVSDHCIIHFKLTIPKPTFPQKTITFRKWKSVDLKSFKQDILDAGLLMLDSIKSNNNTTLTELADKHAPVKSKTITEHPGAEWYTTEPEQDITDAHTHL